MLHGFGNKIGADRFWAGKIEKKYTLEDLVMAGRMILKGILNG
jgi:hypothetical protein